MMARWLVDTDILVRLQELRSPHHQECVDAISKLRTRGELLHICTQVAIEYYVVVTRPVEVNGLGKSSGEALQDLADFRVLYQWLLEPPAIDREWERIVRLYAVAGQQGHDARLVALMNIHNIEYLLTLNKSDFLRYTEIRVVSPAEVNAQQF